jgi:capsule polysaccharide export protein KpsC/LpsZ
LDQLIAGVLIEYSMYFSTSLKSWIRPESAMQLVSDIQNKNIYFEKLRKAFRRSIVRITASIPI